MMTLLQIYYWVCRWWQKYDGLFFWLTVYIECECHILNYSQVVQLLQVIGNYVPEATTKLSSHWCLYCVRPTEMSSRLWHCMYCILTFYF